MRWDHGIAAVTQVGGHIEQPKLGSQCAGASHNDLVGLFADDSGSCGIKNDVATSVTEKVKRKQGVVM